MEYEPSNEVCTKKHIKPVEDPIPLLTAEQVARMLSLKPSTIYDAASRGRLPCVRLWSGPRRPVIRFVLADIERVIRERSTGGQLT